MKRLEIIFLITIALAVVFSGCSESKTTPVVKKSKTEILTEACNNGNASSCVSLGDNHIYTIRPREEDDFMAVKFYTKACSGGNVEGCNKLAYQYYAGKGVRQSYSKAMKLYQKTCREGSLDGCVKMGGMYYSGKGVKKNIPKARRIYGEACDKGSAFGCDSYAQLMRRYYR